MTLALVAGLGFLLAVRGKKNVSLQKRHPDLSGACRETVDLSLTMSLMFVLYEWGAGFQGAQGFIREFSFLFLGLAGYGLSQYQKKTDLFFLTACALVFYINAGDQDFYKKLLWLWTVGAGIGFFQACFLGLQYKLLFSRVPHSVQGWPVFCLLAAAIALVFKGIGQFF